MESVYKVEDLDRDKLLEELQVLPRPKGGKRKRKQPYLFDIVTAFDIETSTVQVPDPETGEDRSHAFMYVWQFQLGPKYTIIGRTWDDFDRLRDLLRDVANKAMRKFKLDERPRYVCYVHNLAYEWQYLQGVYFIENESCFFRDVRKPIYFEFDHLLIMRCSYMHSNMSLAKFGDAVGTTTKKLNGDLFDYSIVRYPWTELSDYELEYCINDVRTLEEAIRLEMKKDGDDLYTIPLTSTGYVRRECKRALEPLRYSITQLLPDSTTYGLLRRCFRGGDTHANRFRVGVVQKDCEGYDIESDYPARQLNYRFPMTPFQKLRPEDSTIERIIRLIAKGNAVIGDYTFKGIHLKNPKDAFPYIPLSKCQALHPVLDNGRILSADMITIGLTEIDLEIIMDQYEFLTIRVDNAMTAGKAMLPQAYRDVIKKYYEAKTALKGIADQEYYYRKSKNKLNAVYGMSAQQPLHPEIVYSPSDPEDKFSVIPVTDPEEATAQLANAAFPYQWGVYTTAYARKALREGLAIIGTDETGISNAIYCDTDSIKAVGHADFTELNKRIRAMSAANAATAVDPKGRKHYIGVWDYEGKYQKFLTHGAKRYCYEDESGDLHVTVSGVTKAVHKYYDDSGIVIKSVPYAVEELGKKGINAFRPGMVWHHAGGTMAVYNDYDDFDYQDPMTGRTVHVGPNVAIVDTTYTMAYERDYAELIENCMLWVKYCHEFGGQYK